MQPGGVAVSHTCTCCDRCPPTHPTLQVSAIHKANIMKKADGLFIECCREVAEKVRAPTAVTAAAGAARRPRSCGAWQLGRPLATAAPTQHPRTRAALCPAVSQH